MQREPPGSVTTTVVEMLDLDTVSKNRVYNNPKDFAELSLGPNGVQVLDVLTPEQPTVEARQADSIIKVEFNGEMALVHFEFQTSDSTHRPMPQRMAGYIGRAIETYGLPVYSNVIYLRPDAGRRDPGRYVQEPPGHRVIIEYKVFRLIELEGQPILDGKNAGLIPFTPLMKPPAGVENEQWLRYCVQTADNLDVPNKAEYLTELAILSGLVYEPQTIRNIISEETMYESSIVRYFAERATQQGHQAGVRERAIEDILEVLALRFQSDVGQTVKQNLEAVDDLQHLKQLFRIAVLADRLEDFQQVLAENGVETRETDRQ